MGLASVHLLSRWPVFLFTANVTLDAHTANNFPLISDDSGASDLGTSDRIGKTLLRDSVCPCVSWAPLASHLWPPLLGGGHGNRHRMGHESLQRIHPLKREGPTDHRAWILDCAFEGWRPPLCHHGAPNFLFVDCKVQQLVSCLDIGMQNVSFFWCSGWIPRLYIQESLCWGAPSPFLAPSITPKSYHRVSYLPCDEPSHRDASGHPEAK